MMGSMSASAAPADATSLLKLLEALANPAQTKAALEQLSALQDTVAAERAAAITDANAARQDRETAERLRKEVHATEQVIAEREQRLTALGTELADREAACRQARRRSTPRQRPLSSAFCGALPFLAASAVGEPCGMSRVASVMARPMGPTETINFRYGVR
jgi:hypothetical protein